MLYQFNQQYIQPKVMAAQSTISPAKKLCMQFIFYGTHCLELFQNRYGMSLFHWTLNEGKICSVSSLTTE